MPFTPFPGAIPTPHNHTCRRCNPQNHNHDPRTWDETNVTDNVEPTRMKWLIRKLEKQFHKAKVPARGKKMVRNLLQKREGGFRPDPKFVYK